MNRERIEQQAKSYTLAVFGELNDFSDVTQAYIDGVEWAIEKFNEWLEDRFYHKRAFIRISPDEGEYEAYEVGCSFESKQAMIADFHKVMRE